MPQRRYAYLIGANGPKDQGITPLQYAEKDIEHLKKAFSGYPCEFADVKSIVAADPSDALNGLDRLAMACEHSDLLIVHFSGHGKAWGGNLYLICNQTQIYPRLLVSTAINISRIKEILDQCSAKHKLLLLDCCHAGAAHAGGTWRGEQDLHEALQVIKGSVSAILSACASQQRARELDTLQMYNDKGAGFLSWALAVACSEQFASVAQDDALSLSDISSWLPGMRDRINRELGPDMQVPLPRLLSEREIAGDDEIWFTTRRRDRSHMGSLEDRRQREEYTIYSQEPFLRQYCFDVQAEDLDAGKIMEYARKQQDFNRFSNGDITDLCKRLDLTSSLGTARRTTVLAFYWLPSRYIPSALIRVTSRTFDSQIYGRDDITGSLDEQVERTIRWLTSNLRTISENVGANKRIDRCEIPEKALRELLVNAVLHRDYEASESVQIKITPKQVTITNPGRLNPAIAMSDQPFLYRESHPRNPLLLEVLIAQHWAEGRARGFETVTEEFKKYGLNLPEIKNLPGGLVQVVIQRPISTASETKVSVLWNVPYRRNTIFTGRKDVLNLLYEQFTQAKTAALPQALIGLGGIGKTQIAVEYAYRYRDKYRDVLWVSATTRDTLITSFLDLAHRLNLPEKDEQDQNITVQVVKRWLEQHDQWLLIVDNADDLALAEEFLPTGGNGHILLTTRAQALGTLANVIDVEKMDTEEGIYLLLRRARVLALDAPLTRASETDRLAAERIVIEMDGLPLALDQAGAYIEETQCSVSEYLIIYHQRQAELLKRRGGTGIAHRETVATTWLLSFEHAERLNPMAADLLRVCAFLAPDAIPEELFVEGATELGPRIQPLTTDATRINDTLGVLLQYSLMKYDMQERMLFIHRLVQAALKKSMNEQTRREWAERTVRAVNLAFPDVNDVTLWEQCKRYLPHAFVCATLIEEYSFEFVEAPHLLNEMAYYLYRRAQYTQAEPLYQRALAIREKQLGPEHPDTAQSLNNLAELYRAQGKYEQAEPLYQRALAIWEKQLGPAHPDTATSLNNLAGLYYTQGKYEQAKPLYQHSLAIREKQLGPEHSDTATSLNNLALLYYTQGKYEQAEPLYQRALAIWEKQLGPEHPNTTHSLNNLANLYQSQGKYEQAEPLYQRALAIWEKQLGPAHPDTATSLNNLAGLYYTQRKYEQAEPLYQRALAIREKQLGPAHPDTATSLNNLAGLYYAQGKYEEAKPLYQRALAIMEEQLGPEHPNTTGVRENYNALVRDMNRKGKGQH